MVSYLALGMVGVFVVVSFLLSLGMVVVLVVVTLLS
jgi:hypothetical protein